MTERRVREREGEREGDREEGDREEGEREEPRLHQCEPSLKDPFTCTAGAPFLLSWVAVAECQGLVCDSGSSTTVL